MKPCYWASDVASLIGEHKYRPADKTLLEVLERHPEHCASILNTRKDLGGRTESEVIQCLPTPVREVLDSNIKVAVSSKTDRGISDAIDTLKKAHVDNVIQDTLGGTRAIKEDTPVVIKEACSRISTGKTTIKEEAEYISNAIETVKKTDIRIIQDTLSGTRAIKEDTPVVIKEACSRISTGETTIKEEAEKFDNIVKVIEKIESSRECNIIVSEIQKQRGTILENSAEDSYQRDTGKIISERNSSARITCDEYTLYGKIDGDQENKVVETKNRKSHNFKHPPIYDIIQLRCYMRMRGNVDGVLLEVFPDGTRRTTDYEWDDNEWKKIHDGLCKVTNRIANMTDQHVVSLAREFYSTE